MASTNSEYFLVGLRNLFLETQAKFVTEKEILYINSRIQKIISKMRISPHNGYIGENQTLQPQSVMSLRGSEPHDPFKKCKILCRQVLGEPGTEAVLEQTGSIASTRKIKSKAETVLFCLVVTSIVLTLLVCCHYVTVPLLLIYVIGSLLGAADLTTAALLGAIRLGWKRRLVECEEMRSIPKDSDLEKIAIIANATLERRGIMYYPQKLDKRRWFYQQLVEHFQSNHDPLES